MKQKVEAPPQIEPTQNNSLENANSALNSTKPVVDQLLNALQSNRLRKKQIYKMLSNVDMEEIEQMLAAKTEYDIDLLLYNLKFSSTDHLKMEDHGQASLSSNRAASPNRRSQLQPKTRHLKFSNQPGEDHQAFLLRAISISVSKRSQKIKIIIKMKCCYVFDSKV